MTGGEVTRARRVDGRSDLWEITVEPDSGAHVSVVLPVTTGCEAQGAVCTGDGKMLSNRAELTVSGPQQEEGEEPQEPPPAPTGLTATVNGDGHIVLTWTAPDDDSVTGYQILRRRPYEGEDTLMMYVEDTRSTETTYTDRDVTAGVRHVYRVKAINQMGLSHWSNYARATPVEVEQPVQNSPATGLPTIGGKAQVGETLAAVTTGIEDADGIDEATFTYQWIADDGNGDTDISGATGSTYTLVSADEGKTIRVKVSFTDDANNTETLTSAATEAVAAKPNTPATGLLTITGKAQVGVTLTANTDAIEDADGLDNPAYTYQWLADDGNGDTDISGATGATYTRVSADEGKTIRVRVSFTDDANNAETLTRDATAAVDAKPNTPATGLLTHHGNGAGGQDAGGEHRCHRGRRWAGQPGLHLPVACRRREWRHGHLRRDQLDLHACRSRRGQDHQGTGELHRRCQQR